MKSWYSFFCTKITGEYEGLPALWKKRRIGTINTNGKTSAEVMGWQKFA
jgi:hypothetical protein